ncbi:WD40 repeat domain-containing protein [Nocardia sp. NPDC127526]|uniref:WD40 repeat domain-containing protein n=1 Tax=Nocardia sp. NPDC127526 TaxID=3345393 RepID=UPI003636690E
MTGDTTIEGQIRSPRALFAQRFTELYEAAGNPTLRRVAAAAETRMRAAQGKRTGGASAQRISDWKAGRNVPARFESLLPVVLTLADLARKSGGDLTRELAEPREWQRLWQSATTWTPEDDSEAACPYLGLNSYRRENRDLFFGRTRPTTELTALVRDAAGIVAVVGASGAGKSSLLAAGLAPAFAEWEVIAFTPGKHPLPALLDATASAPDPSATQLDTTTTQLADHALPSTSQPASRTRRPATGPEPVARESGPPTPREAAAPERAIVAPPTPADAAPAVLSPRPDGPRRLLIIDQFEELFTTCDSERDREDFLAALDRCATRTDDPIAVVIALRADFYAHCLNYLILQDALERRSYLLGPMRMDELAQAISGPARAVGLELEPGLEELVITELCGAGDHHGRRTYDPGALPLLSHVMAAIWQHREGRRLTTSGYRKAGGVVGSVAETAEYAWNELSPTQQSAAREILLGLITVGQDSRDTRRTAQRPDLLRRAPNPEDATAALELLSRTRLITLDADAVTLTHEIMLTAWPRLRTWIDEDRVGYLVRQRLEVDAAEWAAQERDSSLLYRGTRLHNALDNVDPPPVGPLATDFLAAAVTARNRTRRRASRSKALLALLAVALLALGFAAYTQTELAQQRRDDQNFAAVLAEADRLRDIDPSLAAQLNLVAWRMRPGDPDARTKLLQTQSMPLLTSTPGHADGIWQLDYRADGVLASVSWDNTLRLWDVTVPHRARQLGKPLDDVSYVAFSPDGSLMATSKEDAGTRIWDVRDPENPRELAVLPAPADRGVIEMAFAGGGRFLVTMTPARLTLWDMSNPVAPKPGPPHELYHQPWQTLPSPELAVSADGRVLAISRGAGDNDANRASVQLLQVGDTSTPKIVVDRLGSGDAGIYDLVFSPDGKTLAVGTAGSAWPEFAYSGGSYLARFWDLTDLANPRQAGADLDLGSNEPRLAFSPDSAVLATASKDGLTLWNAADPGHHNVITQELSVNEATCRFGSTTISCDGSPYVFTFASDGRTLLVGGVDGELQAWSVPPSLLTGHTGTPEPPLFDGSGNRMVTYSSDGRIAVWDIRNRQAPNRLGEYRIPAGFSRGHLSPDGRALVMVSGSASGIAQVLDLSDPARIRLLSDWQLGQWTTLRISADWRMAATAGDSAIQLWDLSDLARPAAIGATIPLEPDHSSIPTFAPDSRSLFVYQELVTSTSTTIALSQWDITDPQRPRLLGDLLHRNRNGSEYGSRTLVTPDQRTMLIIDHDAIQSWDITDPARPAPLSDPIAEDSRSPGSLRFSVEGLTRLSSVTRGGGEWWDLSDRSRPRKVGPPPVEPAEQQWGVTFHPDSRTVAAIGMNGAIRLWDLDEQHAIDRICSRSGTLLTEELWQRYLPQLPFDPPCN